MTPLTLQGLQGKDRRSGIVGIDDSCAVCAWWHLEVPGVRDAMFSCP